LQILNSYLQLEAPKLVRRDISNKSITHKIGGLLFYLHPWNDFAGMSEGVAPFEMEYEEKERNIPLNFHPWKGKAYDHATKY